MKRYFMEEETHITHKYMRKWSVSLVTRKCQLALQWEAFNTHPTGKNEKKIWQYRKLEWIWFQRISFLNTASRNLNWYNHVVRGVVRSRTWMSNWTELNWTMEEHNSGWTPKVYHLLWANNSTPSYMRNSHMYNMRNSHVYNRKYPQECS